MDWDDYHDHDTLNEFIAALADANDFARIIPIGKSLEGRDMNVLAIEKAGFVLLPLFPSTDLFYIIPRAVRGPMTYLSRSCYHLVYLFTF